MNGQVNSHNVRKYAPKGNNPEFTYEVSMSKEKCMVWMGLCGNGTVLGPFFLDSSVTAHISVDISTWMTQIFGRKIIALHHPYHVDLPI